MKTPLLLLILFLGFTQAKETNIAMHGIEKSQKNQIFYGKVLEIKNAMGYKYLKVDENGTQHWVAIANAPVAVGDTIGYDKKTVMKNFKSKTLKEEFKEIYFASDVYLPQKVEKPKSMKELLGLSSKTDNPHTKKEVVKKPEKEISTKPFIKKEHYTIEEIHMWRKELSGETITLNATVFKVSHNIMKLDWVHLGDGTGNEKRLTDDLVFTATSTSIKSGDKVRATGKVVIDKDFGYGYFYKVIIQDANFEVIK
jgi:hypothetical protein